MNKIIFLLIIISANLFAIPVIKNPELSNAVASVESAIADKQYEVAERNCREIFNSKSKDLQKELETLKSIDNSPYILRLHLILLDCMAHTKQSYSESYKNECLKTIAKYKDLSECKKHIQWAYIHLFQYYCAIYNKKMGIQILKEGADALPKSHLQVYYAINLIDSSPKPLSANVVSEVKRMIKKKKKEVNNNKLTSGMAYCRLMLIKKTEGNIFDEAVDFLKSYPNADFEYIKSAIEIAREGIPFDKPDLVKDYYNMLMILAIKQPDTKDRLKVIGFIINEKKKLEVIMPEIKIQ
ncbi:hypothetical protein KAH27_03540 [bacterium]|nr:hypothetical protein [bacterium]